MKKMDSQTLLAVSLAFLALIVLVVNFLFNSNNKKVQYETKILSDYDEFYTVNSCMYRVITYIYNKDTKSLSLVLTDDYKKKNRINENNVLSYFPKADVGSTFISKKMFYKKINSSLTKYYVYGNIALEDFDGVKDSKDAYFIVYLDSVKGLFSVEPYDGSVFKDGEVDE